MVKQKTAEIMYMAFNNSLPNIVQKLLILYNPIYMIQQNCVFKQKYARTNLKTMCISINGKQLWNSVDSALIHCKCSSFKKTIPFKYCTAMYPVSNPVRVKK